MPEAALQIAMKRREAKAKGEKEKIYPFECRVPENIKERRKPSSVINAKKYRKRIKWERLDFSSRKLVILREIFMQRWAQ